MYLSLYRHHGAPPQTCLRSCVADGTPHLLRFREDDCVTSTQLRHVRSFSHRFVSETHAKAVFRQPHCRRHLPPQALHCVIFTHLDCVLIRSEIFEVHVHLFVVVLCSDLCVWWWGVEDNKPAVLFNEGLKGRGSLSGQQSVKK